MSIYRNKDLGRGRHTNIFWKNLWTSCSNRLGNYKSEITRSSFKFTISNHKRNKLLLHLSLFYYLSICYFIATQVVAMFCTHAPVRAITYVCIHGLPSNLVQMLSFRRCAYIQEYLG